jgi:D-alanine-D-alanine ligase
MGLTPWFTGVVIAYNESLPLLIGEPQDALAEEGVIACAQFVADALSGNGQVRLAPIHNDVELALAPYSPLEWIVFNLGEGLEGRLFEEARIAWAVEAMGFRFTGSSGDAIAHSINKALAKQRLTAAGIPTPHWALLNDPDEATAALGFPLIVKPVAEDASLGVGPEAVVHGLDALRARVQYIRTRYRQAALVERFIVGRELNVSLWGNPPEVLPLAEIDFSDFPDPYERIVSFAAKWERESFAYSHTPVVCPAPLDDRIAGRVRELALATWDAFGCRGYVRVDMRLDERGAPYVIELNCNPDLSPDAGFYRATQAAGHTYVSMIETILGLARR